MIRELLKWWLNDQKPKVKNGHQSPEEVMKLIKKQEERLDHIENQCELHPHTDPPSPCKGA